MTPHAIDRRAYDVAIECAALCMIAIGSPGSGSPSSDEFRMHMREALCEALHLRGALHDREQFVDKFEARNVLSDVVTRALAIFSGDLMPRIGVNISPETSINAELALCDSLRAVLTRIDEMCLSEH